MIVVYIIILEGGLVVVVGGHTHTWIVHMEVLDKM